MTPAEEIKLSSDHLYDDNTENLVEKKNIPTKSSSANNIYNMGMIS